jgi:hypothetical protein
MATPNQLKMAKYFGGMFNFVPGRFMPVLEGLVDSYGGNTIALMHDLSSSGVFQSTLVAGSTRDIAFDLVDRLLGDSVNSSNKSMIVEWSVSRKENGLSWGQILYTLTEALDSITSGPWGVAGDQMRARAAYAAEASESWASQISDIATLRDVYSYAVAPVYSTWHGLPLLTPLERLASASGALSTASAGLGAHAAGEAYTISSADAGKAVLMGAGNDTVTASYADLLKPVFVSGGDGTDTLILHGQPQAYVDFINGYQGVFSTLPYRGFEKIIFQDFAPHTVGSFPGTKEMTFFGGTTGIRTSVGSVDNGTTFNFLGLTGGTAAELRFSEFAPFNDISFVNASPGSQSSAPLLVDSMTFNVTAGTGGQLILPRVPAKNITLNIESSAGSTSNFFTLFRESGTFVDTLPDLVTFKLSSNVNHNFQWTANSLKGLDFSGSTGRVEMALTRLGATVNDGLVDSISVSAPTGLFAFNWSAPSTVAKADSYFAFSGEYKAGSTIKVAYNSFDRAASLPATKVVFNSDFSELNYYNSQVGAVLGNTKVSGSLFDVNGVQNAAVYFKGVAGQGQTVGTIKIAGYDQTTIVKVDSGSGINVITQGATNALTAFINKGLGSVLDNIKTSIATQFSGQTVNEMTVAGGKIIWVDQNNNGRLDGLVRLADSMTPWNRGADFVMFETSDANLATFSQSIQLLGFNAIVDPFL